MARPIVPLWRPVGPHELALIEASGWRTFPPRLPEQPIFYPVLNLAYAEQIARDWNSTSAEQAYKGFVTEFDCDATYISSFEPQLAGGSQHKELWIPAEQLDEFNSRIQGRIRVVAEFHKGRRIDRQA